MNYARTLPAQLKQLRKFKYLLININIGIFWFIFMGRHLFHIIIMHCITRVFLVILSWRGNNVGLSGFQDFCCYLVNHGPSLFYQSAEPHILLLIPDSYLAFVNTPVKSHSMLFSFPYNGGGHSMFSEQLKRKMEAEPWSPVGKWGRG